jgi:4-carboxymuconolactone decarboxylase
LKRWLVFGNHILSKSLLPEREREMVILRMGWLCRAEYEWGHHVFIAKQAGGKQAGLSSDEIRGARLLDLIFRAGQYTPVSMALNSCGVQLEDGFEEFPDEVEG